MVDLVDQFKPVGHKGTQFAALCFDYDVEKHFFLNEGDNALEYKNLINDFGISQSPATRTSKGLKVSGPTSIVCIFHQSSVSRETSI